MEDGTSKSPPRRVGFRSIARADSPLGTTVAQLDDARRNRGPECCGDAAGYDNDPFQWDAREDCEVRQILDRIGDKWSLLTIALLEGNTLRFSELKRRIDGISQRMLTVTLRRLERDGLVRRTVYPTVPPQVDYRLTTLGSTLHDTVQALVGWTEAHRSEIAAARDEYDARGDRGEDDEALAAV